MVHPTLLKSDLKGKLQNPTSMRACLFPGQWPFPENLFSKIDIFPKRAETVGKLLN